MESVRFNVFQRILRQWDALHAYNAAQVLHLAGSADLDLLAAKWNEALRALGIGAVHVSGKRYWIDSPGEEPQPLCVPGHQTLEAFMSDQMNRPFAPTNNLPFRPFLIEQNGSYLAGVVYHHWIADSASIRMVMREWFMRCFDPARARSNAVPIAARGYWHHFGPHTSRWTFDQGFVSMFSWFSRFRRVRRIESEGVHDFDMRFTMHTFPDGAIHAIRSAAHELQVTVNDFFLAAMAQACDRYVPARHMFRRHDLALGTIVDLRSRGKNELGETFGMFLGFTSVFVRPHELRDFDRMVRSIAKQTKLHKRGGVPEASMMRMAGGLAFHRFFGENTKELVNFYRKRFPLCAGISNVNLNDSWVHEYHPAPLMEYIRVSPTGPMMPVVFTPTTLGDRLHFGLSTRDSIVAPANAQALADFFRTLVLRQAHAAVLTSA